MLVKQPTNVPSKSSPLSPKRKWFFRAVLVLFPIFLLVLLEFILRITGYGTDYRLFIPSSVDNRYLEPNPQLGRRYFPGGKFYPNITHSFLLKEKPANGFRIFVLGGSTARGYPYYYNGSFSSMLRVMLQKSYPNIYFEVVNLAMVAVNSYTVQDIAREIWRYQPDLVLVYSGHNEFYGALGVGSLEQLGTSRKLVLTYLWLNRFKTVQLLRQLARGIMGALGGGTSELAPNMTLMEHLAARRSIAHGSPLYRKAMTIFQQNMAEVVELCRNHRVPLLLGTLVSNVHHQPPFTDTFHPETDTATWQQLFRKALQAPPHQADSLFQQLFHLDDFPASAHFQYARLAESQQRWDSAYVHFYRAKDYDGLRFRASEDFNGILQELASVSGAILVPIRRSFESHSPHHLPGKELFLEHLHPNLQGYFLMARTFYRAIVSAHLIPGEAHALPADSLLWQDMGITEFEHAAGEIRIRVLTSGWPFRKGSVGTLDSLSLTPGDMVHKLALDYWQKKITWEKAHVLLAEHYLKSGQWQKAAAEFKALIVFTPFNPSPYQHLVRLLIEHQRYREAIPYLQTLTRLSWDLFAFRTLGMVYLQQGYPEKAIPYFRTALDLYASDEESLFYLAASYFQLGQIENARMYVERLLRVNPRYPDLPHLQQLINKNRRD